MNSNKIDRPRLLITMGDVAGIGPEIIAKAWPALTTMAIPIVVGDRYWLEQSIRLVSSPCKIKCIGATQEARPTPEEIPLLEVTKQDLSSVKSGQICAAAGQSAYDFLKHAISLTLKGEADGIVTCPLHKAGLHAAGLKYPGHTEILAELTNSPEFAMLLYGDGLAVAHVTLHMALRQIFANITISSVLEKIKLLNHWLPPLLGGRPARLAVAAVNPHAGDEGLFGDEEEKIIRPAVQLARTEGIQVTGPLPADTLFVRAHRGEFDGIIAMYHDEGHIAMKLRSGMRCVNITAGLPIIRTSVAHGTAYDIAGKGIASGDSLIAATEVASKLSSWLKKSN